jgi:hypothetical protein
VARSGTDAQVRRRVAHAIEKLIEQGDPMTTSDHVDLIWATRLLDRVMHPIGVAVRVGG